MKLIGLGLAAIVALSVAVPASAAPFIPPHFPPVFHPPFPPLPPKPPIVKPPAVKPAPHYNSGSPTSVPLQVVGGAIAASAVSLIGYGWYVGATQHRQLTNREAHGLVAGIFLPFVGTMLINNHYAKQCAAGVSMYCD